PLGRAGHARALLEACPGLFLVGIDADVAAIEAAGELLAPYAERVTLVHARYDEIPAIMSAIFPPGPDRVMGLLFDLGVSSPQLDDPARGFAYAQDAPLDMRMDRTAERTAADVVNGYPPARPARARARGRAAVPPAHEGGRAPRQRRSHRQSARGLRPAAGRGAHQASSMTQGGTDNGH